MSVLKRCLLVISVITLFITNSFAASSDVYHYVCPSQASNDYYSGFISNSIYGYIQVVKNNTFRGYLHARGPALHYYPTLWTWWEFRSAAPVRNVSTNALQIECFYHSGRNLATLVATLPSDLNCNLVRGTTFLRCTVDKK